tara:strand:+ start:229 stop:1557 length:1329 start_codon:yes stop_codon:yes gene_type:complete
MSFATGFITGLAKSVDEQLKKDMERTQDRIQGMAQYRVTRRRADIEKKDKDKEELRETILKLSTLVNDDTTKAIQMYKSVGGNVADANKFYDQVYKSKTTLGDDFDLSKAVEFAEFNLPTGVSKGDFLNNFIDGSIKYKSAIPAKDTDVAGGLYTALFKPKIGEQIMKQADAQAPIPKNKEFDTFIPGAKINFNQFLEAKQYEKSNRLDVKGTFGSAYIQLETAADYETDPIKKKELQKKADKYLKLHLDGQKKSSDAEGVKKSLFSKETISTLIKRKSDDALKKSGLIKSVGDEIKVLFEGNEADFFNTQDNVIKGLEMKYESINPADEPILFDAIKAEKFKQFQERKTYKDDLRNKYFESIDDQDDDTFDKYVPKAATASIIGNITNIPPDSSLGKEQLKKLQNYAYKNRIAKGTVYEYSPPNVENKILRFIWTGNRFIN